MTSNASLLHVDDHNAVVNVQPQQDQQIKHKWFQRRYCVCLLLGIGLFNVYAMRINLSVAIEPMSCQFNWNSFTQGLILAAFFAGYLFGNVPGGYLANKFGGKLIFGIGVLCTALLSVILPFCTSGSFLQDGSLNCWCSNDQNWCFYHGTYTNNDDKCLLIHNSHSSCNYHSYLYILIILRFFMGLFESVTFPALFALVNHWSGKYERSRMVGISFAGMYIGNILGFPLSSFIIASESSYGGWNNVFYLFSICGILWWILWILFVFDSPIKDPYISQAELSYLKNELPTLLMHKHPKQDTYIEWKSFFTEPAALALYAAHFSYNWSFYTLLTELPTYLNDELDFQLSSAGFISVLPYLSQFVMTIISAIIVDKILVNDALTATNARKMAHTIGTIIPGVLLVICGYLNNSTYVVILLSISTALMGCVNSGFAANYTDVSPTLSSIMYGISNTIATFPGVVSPILSGYILSGDNKKQEWKLIFYIACMIFVIGTIIYWIIGTANIIPSLGIKERSNLIQNTNVN